MHIFIILSIINIWEKNADIDGYFRKSRKAACNLYRYNGIICKNLLADILHYCGVGFYTAHNRYPSADSCA